ncbi:MAG: FAD binding domain-containing protein [Actinomycetota bacterium]|jgi:carbon-monoxide dehydrogenase medium subunit|nr:FAD binding domain-containing protein [Actinomycetota bacterium]
MSSLHPVQEQTPTVDRVITPRTIHDALVALSDHGQRARPIAGGTDLLLELGRNSQHGVEVMIDLSRIDNTRSISVDAASITLGMGVTHADVIASVEVAQRALPLVQACLEIGSPQLRNRATVAGNVVTASPANDTISALMALDASVTLTTLEGQRTVRLAEFYDGFRSTVLGHAELLTSISIPALGRHQRGVFVKLGNRAAQAISVVHAAMVVTFDQNDPAVIADITVALGSVAPTVVLVEGLRQLARGNSLGDVAATVAAAAAASISPIDDIRASAEYRANTIAVVVERGLMAIADGSERSQLPQTPPLLRVRGETTPSRRATDIGDGDRVSCTINGTRRAATSAASSTLLEWLRDQHGLTGTKEGCAEGECGACTVHLDGQAVLACMVPAASAEDCDITTVEGLGNGDHLDPIQASFARTGGVQCGFCTPGFIMSASMLLAECSAPDRSHIEQGLAGNLCRCTGYYSIIAAVREATPVGDGQ